MNTVRSKSGGCAPALDQIIGESQPVIELKQIIQRISQYDFPVLIHGESGTGKELVAKAIHQSSSRADKPFRALNCAAFTPSLIEAELFGYVGGAFTGARREGSPGVFEIARHGSLFLDEIADLSSHAQAALLRVLEEYEVVRVGGRHAIPIDVRVIAACNRPLDELVNEGRFRHDLYHRLCVIPVNVPPLRERREDIPLLVSHFLRKLGDTRVPGPEVMDCLSMYPWSGNVRELEHCIDYMVATTVGDFTVASLPPGIRAGAGCDRPGFGHESVDDGSFGAESFSPDQLFILRSIATANAKGFGLGRRSLALKARQHGLHLTESSMRSRLHELRVKGLVQWSTGRAGIRLTPKGQRLLQVLQAATVWQN